MFKNNQSAILYNYGGTFMHFYWKINPENGKLQFTTKQVYGDVKHESVIKMWLINDDKKLLIYSRKKLEILDLST